MDDAPPFGTHAPQGLARRLIALTRRLPETWASRRLTIVLRRIGLRLLGGKPVDTDALGVLLRLNPYNNICDKRLLFAPQTFDPAELAILARSIGPGFVFVDVGANIGAYSLFVASRADRTSRILAVEPQPAIFDRLVYNIRLNELATVKAIACAVADKAGELTLFLDRRNSGEASVKIVGASDADTLRVPAVTLRDLLEGEGFTHVDAIKLDIEGAEDLVLEPFFAQAPPALHPRLLILENGLRQWQTDLPALLGQNGYRRMATTRLNLVYERAA